MKRRAVLVTLAALGCRRAPPQDETRTRRENMVDGIAARWPVQPRVLRAMREVPRHRFVPDQPLAEAYADKPLPIGEGQVTSQPSMIAIMTDALELTGRERVLEIGTGAGYQTAILAKLAREVYTVEILRTLSEAARARLDALGLRNVHFRVGDGFKGAPEDAPFDRVLVTAAPRDVPPPLIDQLADGGVLVAPIGDPKPHPAQRLVRIRKDGGTISEETLGPVHFTPLVPVE